MTFLPAPSAIAAAYMDPWRYAGTYGGYRPDPPPSRYVRFRRWLQERLWRKRKWRHASANVAFVRLEHIIAADRAAVPCGRWVQVRDACVAVDRWQYQNYMRRAFGLKELPPLPSREVLPRYRWSERR